MPSIKIIVQLVEDGGQVHQNETDINLSEFKDPSLVGEEERLHAFNRTFGFLVKSVQHFIRFWAKGSESASYFRRLEQYAKDRGLGTADTMALMAGALHSDEGTSHLQLPLQVLEPMEGDDFPRPKFPTRYQRGQVL